MTPNIEPAKDLVSYNADEDDYDDYADDEDKAYLVVNSLPQKKQRKNFIRPFELSVSLV